MGSGKGQNRRAQSILPSGDAITKYDVRFHRRKWDEFLNSNDLGNMNIYKYYIGSIPYTRTAENILKVLKELFTDAVTIGAINLPTPYKAEDFTFHNYKEGGITIVSPKNVHCSVYLQWLPYPEKDKTMTSATHALRAINTGIVHLLLD